MKRRPAGIALAALNTAIVAGALLRAGAEALIWVSNWSRPKHKTW